jgi:hypothetical protein
LPESTTRPLHTGCLEIATTLSKGLQHGIANL